MAHVFSVIPHALTPHVVIPIHSCPETKPSLPAALSRLVAPAAGGIRRLGLRALIYISSPFSLLPPSPTPTTSLASLRQPLRSSPTSRPSPSSFSLYPIVSPFSLPRNQSRCLLPLPPLPSMTPVTRPSSRTRTSSFTSRLAATSGSALSPIVLPSKSPPCPYLSVACVADTCTARGSRPAAQILLLQFRPLARSRALSPSEHFAYVAPSSLVPPDSRRRHTQWTFIRCSLNPPLIRRFGAWESGEGAREKRGIGRGSGSSPSSPLTATPPCPIPASFYSTYSFWLAW